MKLDVGLRYDYLPSPTEATTSSSRSIRVRRRWRESAQRLYASDEERQRFPAALGIVWTPTADGKLAVRGVYAVMVNQSNTGYFVGEANNPPLTTPLSGQAAGTDDDCPDRYNAVPS